MCSNSETDLDRAAAAVAAVLKKLATALAILVVAGIVAFFMWRLHQ